MAFLHNMEQCHPTCSRPDKFLSLLHPFQIPLNSHRLRHPQVLDSSVSLPVLAESLKCRALWNNNTQSQVKINETLPSNMAIHRLCC